MKKLPNRQIIEVSGEENISFLQNLVTNDLNKLETEKLIHTFVLNPSGKIIYEFYIFRDSNLIYLDCNINICQELMRHLNFYKLRAKVAIKILNNLNIYWQQTNDSIDPTYCYDPRGFDLGYRRIHKANAGSVNALEEYDALRISEGCPEIINDFGSAEIFPHEILNFNKSISYEKGCFPGQEITSRVFHKEVKAKKIFRQFKYQNNIGQIGKNLLYKDKVVGIFASRSFYYVIAHINREYTKDRFYIRGETLIKIGDDDDNI